MSINEQTPLSQPTSVVRNTLGKEPVPQDPGRPISDEALREYCDRNYHQILPIIAEKVHQEKAQQEKLKAVKARLNFEETSHHSESGTPIRRRGPKERLGPRGKMCPYTQTTQGVGRTTVATGTLKAATKVLDQEQRSPLPRDVITKGHPREERRSFQKARVAPEVIGSQRETESLRKSSCGGIVELYVGRKGAPRCMKISGFMHGITNPELIKRLHDKIPKSVDEMMRVTTAFLRGEVAASNRERKKSFPSWKQHEANQKQNFKKGGFRNQQRSERKQDRFALLTKTPKEIFALDKGKFKAPPPMTTPVEKRNANKFCEFHGEVGYNTDECMHLRKQIEEMLKAGKLSHLIKEIKQNNGKEQPKVTKKGETAGKDKAMAILMVQPWERVARQRITQSFSPNSEILFPPLGEDEGTEGPMIIEAEIGGHCVHRISEIIWPIGQIQLLVTIGDEEHSASDLMNFVVVRSPSPYNGIIGRPRVKKLQAVPSTVHGMLKIPVEGGVITLKSSKLVPLECVMVSGPERTLLDNEPTVEERIKVAINPEHPEQTIMIRSTLTKEGRNKLCSLLQQNLEVFAWKPADMT
ncbi:hypothetical protein Tco_1219155 [Tanacetum coccineum]